MMQNEKAEKYKLVQLRAQTYQALKQIQELFSKETDGGKISMDRVISNLIPKSNENED